MLNIKDHLLACAGEEAGEVQQAVGKALRFGLVDLNPATKETNFSELRKEVHDLIAVYELICEEMHFNSKIDIELLNAKKAKVSFYMEYASDVGRLKVT